MKAIIFAVSVINFIPELTKKLILPTIFSKSVTLIDESSDKVSIIPIAVAKANESSCSGVAPASCK